MVATLGLKLDKNGLVRCHGRFNNAHIPEEAKKVWICLFTCVTVRPIHLEAVDDLTAEQFLMALISFFSRRGAPEEIILDNGPQFKLTKTTVNKAWKLVITDE